MVGYPRNGTFVVITLSPQQLIRNCEEFRDGQLNRRQMTQVKKDKMQLKIQSTTGHFGSNCLSCIELLDQKLPRTQGNNCTRTLPSMTIGNSPNHEHDGSWEWWKCPDSKDISCVCLGKKAHKVQIMDKMC
jgi:hypothetical protein